MEQGRSTSLRFGEKTNKLIPRDINESLGKLPPQAQDLEEAVLGAVMLEKNALPTVVSYLKPAHFYNDAHKEIFQACVDLHTGHEPVDMRTVVNQLRKNGKLELVGGAYKIAELTSKVSSAANIEYHARVVIEMAIKRSMIQVASQIHHDAYEDTTDFNVLLEGALGELQFIKDNETTSSGPERIKALWEKLQIKDKPERPETLIKFGDADVCTVGNISLLVGKKKSRKSLLVTHLLHLFLKPDYHLADDLVIFDTEQEEYDVWRTKDVIYRMTNQHIPIFCLRGLSPQERRDFIEQTVIHWHKPLKIAVIDGIRDCMSNINDPDETTQVMSWLMRLNVDYRIHFMNVLHLNKTDNNARGHIGSELLNKAEITIEVEFDEKSGHSKVKCESSRRKPFEPFMFTHGPTGLPEILGAVIGEERVNDDDKFKKLQAAFDEQTLKYKDLMISVKAQFGVGDNRARQLISSAVSRGWVMKNGRDRSPDATYKLIATQNFPPVEVPVTQTSSLFTQAPPPPPPVHEESDELPF